VLVDAQTSGAAEALAAMLVGGGRGVMLIGAATRGDPAVRELVPLPDGGTAYLATRRLVAADGSVYAGREGIQPAIRAGGQPSAPDYEPPKVPGQPAPSDEEKESLRLRQRVKDDPALRRAVDVLLGLRALNLRGFDKPQNPAR